MIIAKLEDIVSSLRSGYPLNVDAAADLIEDAICQLEQVKDERSALIRDVADHVTVRAEQYAQIQALAVQCQEMREALEPFSALYQEHLETAPNDRPVFGINCKTITVGDLRKAKTFVTPDSSSQILARHDAAIWREAAEICALYSDGRDMADSCAEALRVKADEVEKVR